LNLSALCFDNEAVLDGRIINDLKVQGEAPLQAPAKNLRESDALNRSAADVKEHPLTAGDPADYFLF